MAGHASGWRRPCWLTEKQGSGYRWDMRFSEKQGGEGKGKARLQAEGWELQGVFQEAKHPERGQRARRRRKERYEYHGSLDLLYRYIVSFLFLNSLCGLLDYMLSFTDHVWAMVYLLISPSLLWVALRVMQLCSNFTMHRVGVLFCFHFYEMHSSLLTYS